MNVKTGELYENYEEALKDLQSTGMSAEDIREQLMPLNSYDYSELKGMNRAQRRQWAREHKKKK